MRIFWSVAQTFKLFTLSLTLLETIIPGKLPLYSQVLLPIQVDIYAGSVFLYEAIGWNIYLSSAIILAITAVYTMLGKLLGSVSEWVWESYIITYIIFKCSPRGFSATCLQQMQGLVVESLSQTATSGSQWFFVWDIKLCPQLTVHDTDISLLLSTSVWVLSGRPIERRETRPTA